MRILLATLAVFVWGCGGVVDGGTPLGPSDAATDDAADHCCLSADPSVLPDCDLGHNDICHSGDVDGGFLCIPRTCVQFPAATSGETDR